VGVQIGATGERYEGVSQTVQLDLLPETYQKALEQGLRLELRLKRAAAAVAVRIGVGRRPGRACGLAFGSTYPPCRSTSGRSVGAGRSCRGRLYFNAVFTSKVTVRFGGELAVIAGNSHLISHPH